MNELTHRSLHLKLPAIPPYAGVYDLESFVGEQVKPIVDRLQLFWFSRYGISGNREIKFRFSVEDYDGVKDKIEAIEKAFEHGADGCGNYDYVADLGNDRFIAPDRKVSHQADRSLLVYQFLTAGARMFVDCLVQDGPGWKHEEETTSFYNRITPLETIHHLFCNMTNVPTWAAVLLKDGKYEVVSDLDGRTRMKADPNTALVGLPRITH